jgi:hypothetical protein
VFDGWNGGSASFTDADGAVVAGPFAVEGASGSFEFTIGSTCTEYTYSCGDGSWGSEVSWVLGDYSGGTGDGAVCLEDGDHTLTMNDAYGDGWNGNSWTLSGDDGVIASCTLESGATGDCNFSTGGAPPVAGCTDPGAPNYDADAEVDDGSCDGYCADGNTCGNYVLNYGYTCEQMEGYGYDCTSCWSDGSCPVVGCTDDTAEVQS